MRIAITGSTGMVGSVLTDRLSRAGSTITRVTHSQLTDPAHRVVVWSPADRHLDAAALEDHDVVIHLAGENISSGRWTKRRKREIHESRVTGTTLLAETLANLKRLPRVLLSASAIGYYGVRGPEEVVDEQSEPGDTFLTRVCQNWEEATQPAEHAGIRVVHMRFGVILSRNGGALAKMLPAFKLGIGGRIGSGEQMMSWVALEEIPKMVQYIIQHEAISGPVNFVAPHPVSNRDFTRALGKALQRPTVIPIPVIGMRLLFGEMAEELLIGGSRVIPRQLLEYDYEFSYPEITPTLKTICRPSS